MSKRGLLARGLSVWPLRSLLPRLVPRSALTGLTYHRIGEPDDLDPGLVSCTYDELRWQGQWLKRNTRVLHGSEIVPFLDGRLNTDKPATCITFDDGYADNLRAGEILREIDVPAIFFVVSSFVGSKVIPDWDRLAHAIRHSSNRRVEVEIDGKRLSVDTHDKELANKEALRFFRRLPVADQPRFLDELEKAAGTAAAAHPRPPLFMDWDQVRALAAMGHTVAAHTDTHPILSTVPAEQQRRELKISKERLESELSQKVDLFAYPVGQRSCFTAETQRLVAETGYTAAFSFYGGHNRVGEHNRFDLRRIPIAPEVTRPLFKARAMYTPLYDI